MANSVTAYVILLAIFFPVTLGGDVITDSSSSSSSSEDCAHGQQQYRSKPLKQTEDVITDTSSSVEETRTQGVYPLSPYSSPTPGKEYWQSNRQHSNPQPNYNSNPLYNTQQQNWQIETHHHSHTSSLDHQNCGQQQDVQSSDKGNERPWKPKEFKKGAAIATGIAIAGGAVAAAGAAAVAVHREHKAHQHQQQYEYEQQQQQSYQQPSQQQPYQQPYQQPPYQQPYQQPPYQQPSQQQGVKRDFGCNWCMLVNCKPGACQASRNFNAQADADVINNAMKGLTVDEDTIVNILIHRSEEQIELIRHKFQEMGMSLDVEIKKHTMLKLEDLLMALLQYREDFFAEELYNAFRHNNDDAMAMILTSVSPCAVKEIGSAYYRKYNKNIIDDAKAGSMAYFEDYIVELIKGRRDPEGRIDRQRVRKDATDLASTGPSTWFRKESVFIDIFTHRSYSHIREVQEEYDSTNPTSLKKVIRRETGTSGLGKGLLIMLKNIENQPDYFANEIEGAAIPPVGPGTRDNKKLIRILRGRCGIDLGDIRDAYPMNHDSKELTQMIKDRTYGHYERALIGMCSEDGW